MTDVPSDNADARDAATVVIPVYNEEDIVARNLRELAGHLETITGAGNWRIIVVDNNSTDKTRSIVDKITGEFSSIRCVHQDLPDFGRAVARGLNEADTPFCYVLSIDEWDVPFMSWAWRSREAFDLFIGTKRADPTINRQAGYRRFLSWGLNGLLQLLFEFTGTDTHGPKFMRKSSMRSILDGCVMGRGQYDTEFVLKAQRGCLRVVEVPVAYAEQRPPRNFMVQKIARNVRDLFRLYAEMRKHPHQGPLRIYRFPREEILSLSVDHSDKTPANGGR